MRKTISKRFIPPLAHAGLGEAYWRLWRLTKNPEHAKLAEAHAQRAVALDATLAEAWITLGIIHTGTGKAEQAVDDLQRDLAREPRNPDAYRELANAYRRLQRHADAEGTYERALELQPDSWVTRNNYASYLFAVGQQRYGDAEAQYKRALEIVPDNARLWYNLGGTHWYQGKRDEARAAFRKSLELSPTAPAAGTETSESAPDRDGVKTHRSERSRSSSPLRGRCQGHLDFPMRIGHNGREFRAGGIRWPRSCS